MGGSLTNSGIFSTLNSTPSFRARLRAYILNPKYHSIPNPSILHAKVGVVYQATAVVVLKLPIGGTQEAMIGYRLAMAKINALRMLRKGLKLDFARHLSRVLNLNFNIPTAMTNPNTATTV